MTLLYVEYEKRAHSVVFYFLLGRLRNVSMQETINEEQLYRTDVLQKCFLKNVRGTSSSDIRTSLLFVVFVMCRRLRRSDENTDWIFLQQCDLLPCF